ncbi:MAG: RluA family pseudouridine synthase [Nitrospirae bacterium]|nr:RluA family pseudouridine synthase [Nitrospirota bacterium]
MAGNFHANYNRGISSVKEIIRVTASDRSKRLDIFAAEKTGITRSQIRLLINNGHLLVNSRTADPAYKVQPLDAVEIVRPEPEADILIPEPCPLDILYSDEHLAVVNKQAGMVVYPSAGHKQGTLLNALASRFTKMASIGGPLRPGVVHRLDKDTSGVMVVALDDAAYYNLADQFKNRTINRLYRALIYGNIKDNAGEIVLNIGRSSSDRKKMSTRTRRGKEAVTRWKATRRFGIATLIEAKLGTGRTHQIRVHFAAIGHPVLGDTTYGKKTSVEVKQNLVHFPRQMLHAELLGFTHPGTGQYMEFSSPLPSDMEECIAKLSV